MSKEIATFVITAARTSNPSEEDADFNCLHKYKHKNVDTVQSDVQWGDEFSDEL
jgi:hypothetical protein